MHVPVHVGFHPPGSTLNPTAHPARGRRDDVDWGELVQASNLATVTVDWDNTGVEPRWLGAETADCVVALQPGVFSNTGGSELKRFLAGAKSRGETALVISLVGHTVDTRIASSVFGTGSSTYVFNPENSVSGKRLPSGAMVTLAPDLDATDADLGKRLLNRQVDSPWWRLTLHGITVESMVGGQQSRPPVGTLHPIVIDALRNPVAAMWLSPDETIRWYVLPDSIDWNTVLDWLVRQAIPTLVPDAARRYRTPGYTDPNLTTPAEQAAERALQDLEHRYVRERADLQAALDTVRDEAEELRQALFYGIGTPLVRGVETVLRAAGFDVVDLDTELGAPLSADLLVSIGDLRQLVEVKSERRNPKEALVNDLTKHLGTWSGLRPELPVGGGVLVVNHQHTLPPAKRDQAVFQRREFVNSLSVPVLSTRQLFDGWAARDWARIRQLVFGVAAPEPTAPLQPAAAQETSPIRKRRWFGKQN